MAKNFLGASLIAIGLLVGTAGAGLLAMWLLGGSPRAGASFLESDDYREKKEAVGVFLKEDDYRLMVEDIERNGEVFDWGWVETAAAPSGGGGQSDPARPENLGFSLRSYKTVSIPTVENFAGLLQPKTADTVRESFVQAMQAERLEVTDDKADLELAIAIVGYEKDSKFGRRAPFIGLELRLKETTSERNLVLLRSRAHGTTPTDAAFNYASALLKFLR